MRIVSWNLWWRHGPWRQRRPAIVATLTEITPDVCGLQEVWGSGQETWRYAAPGDPGHSWDRRNSHVGTVGVLDARIDYLLVGMPCGGRGRVRSAWLAGTAPVDGVWPSDHFAVVADLTTDGGSS